MKYKVGDTVIGIKNDPEYTHIDIIGKIGTITKVNSVKDVIDRYYEVEFEGVSDCRYREDEIKLYLTKLKLKKLLED